MTNQTQITTQTQIDSNYFSQSTLADTNQQLPLISAFLSRLPEWGGDWTTASPEPPFENVTYHFINTCTIDYLLLCLLLCKQLSQDWNLIDQFDDKVLIDKIKEIVNFISLDDWINAKKTWIIDISKKNESRKKYDCFASEYDIFISLLTSFQTYELFCKNEKCGFYNVCVKEGDQLNFKRDSKGDVILVFFAECSICKTDLSARFSRKPLWFFIQTLY